MGKDIGHLHEKVLSLQTQIKAVYNCTTGCESR